MPIRPSLRRRFQFLSLLLVAPAAAALDRASSPAPLLSPAATEALALEVSGASALRTAEGLSRHHRMRGSHRLPRRGRADRRRRCAAAGFADADFLELPADGSRLLRHAALAAALERALRRALGGGRERRAARAAGELGRGAARARAGQRTRRRSRGPSWSTSAPARRIADYAGRDVAGEAGPHLRRSPVAVARLAVERFGAAGIVSWAQNQKQGWWGEDASLVRWGHLDTFARQPTFAFMVSPARARALAARLAAGETVRLSRRRRRRHGAGRLRHRHRDDSGRRPGARRRGDRLELPPRPSAPGRQRQRQRLRHDPRGRAHALEARRRRAPAAPAPHAPLRLAARDRGDARAARRTARDRGADPRGDPPRHGRRRPGDEGGLPRHARAGEPAVVRARRGRRARRSGSTTRRSPSRPPAKPAFPLVAAGGGKEPLRAELVPFHLGSDHEVYNDSSFAIPAVYFNDWPDRYIHTEPRRRRRTSTRRSSSRAAFLAAATGWALANLDRGRRPSALARSSAPPRCAAPRPRSSARAASSRTSARTSPASPPPRSARCSTRPRASSSCPTLCATRPRDSLPTSTGCWPCPMSRRAPAERSTGGTRRTPVRRPPSATAGWTTSWAGSRSRISGFPSSPARAAAAATMRTRRSTWSTAAAARSRSATRSPPSTVRSRFEAVEEYLSALAEADLILPAGGIESEDTEEPPPESAGRQLP